MRARLFWMAALAAIATGCGEGRLIFNVDVFSFLQTSSADQLPYRGPLLGLPDTIPVQSVRSLGIGTSSIVDTARFTGTVIFVNDSGTGSVQFAVYFDTVASNVYNTTPAFSVTGAVTRGKSDTVPFDIPDIQTALKPLFLTSSIYVGIKASTTSTGTPPDTVVKGTAVLKALQARIVITDKIF